MASSLAPEIQYELYTAIRDGNIEKICVLLRIDDLSSSLHFDINSAPFESLWHPPGDHATCLHLAVCAVRPNVVEFLLNHGADPYAIADGRTAFEMIDAFELFEPGRVQRPDDMKKVEQILNHAKK